MTTLEYSMKHYEYSTWLSVNNVHLGKWACWYMPYYIFSNITHRSVVN